MATVAEPRLLTAEEFMAADLGEGNFELMRGEVHQVTPPAMPEHGRVCANAIFVLESYGRNSGYGYCLAKSAVLTERNPDTVRGPDVSFYSETRWPRSQVGNSLPPVPPDLIVEVVSPGNRIGEIVKKVAEYLEVGVSLVWVVYPTRRKVVIYRATEDEMLSLHENDVVENLAEAPGFRSSVAEFFV